MFEKILVPVDFSDYAKKSLKVAIKIAKKFNGDIVLIHVIPSRAKNDQNEITGKLRENTDVVEMIENKIQNVGVTLLNQSKEIVVGENVPVQTLLREGHVVEEILSAIRDGGFDLVVLGARGQSTIKDLHLGSVCAGVVRYAGCYVLVVKN